MVCENGAVQKVIVEIETTENRFIHGNASQLIMAYAAFVGADKSVNAFELYSRDNLSYFNKIFDDFTFSVANYKVSNVVEYSGYTGSDNILIPKDNEEQYFHLKFVIERL